jgi:hypothetical protein
MSSVIYFLSKLPQSLKDQIFDEIPLSDYENVRLVCRYFYGIIQLKVDILEAECEKKISKIREELMQTALKERQELRITCNENLGRLPNPDHWLSIEAWYQQTLHTPVLWKAEDVWYNVHKQLYETDRFFCAYCVRVGNRDEMVRLPLSNIGVHRGWFDFKKDPYLIMRHSFHRSCYNHWRQWLSFHGKDNLLGSKEFCCRCQEVVKKIPTIPPLEGFYHMPIGSPSFGLMVNRFYLDP